MIFRSSPILLVLQSAPKEISSICSLLLIKDKPIWMIWINEPLNRYLPPSPFYLEVKLKTPIQVKNDLLYTFLSFD